MADTWIETYTGVKFDLMKPRTEDVNLADIAHALSMICRYTGHCKQFHSVAQHSVLVARLLDREDTSIYGLLHDAHEAYIGDISTPLKNCIESNFSLSKLKESIQTVIYEGLKVPPPGREVVDIVSKADSSIMEAESKLLLGHCSKDWGFTGNQLYQFKGNIPMWSPGVAEGTFTDEFLLLYLSIKNKGGEL